MTIEKMKESVLLVLGVRRRYLITDFFFLNVCLWEQILRCLALYRWFFKKPVGLHSHQIQCCVETWLWTKKDPLCDFELGRSLCCVDVTQPRCMIGKRSVTQIAATKKLSQAQLRMDFCKNSHISQKSFSDCSWYIVQNGKGNPLFSTFTIA